MFDYQRKDSTVKNHIFINLRSLLVRFGIGLLIAGTSQFAWGYGAVAAFEQGGDGPSHTHYILDIGNDQNEADREALKVCRVTADGLRSLFTITKECEIVDRFLPGQCAGLSLDRDTLQLFYAIGDNEADARSLASVQCMLTRMSCSPTVEICSTVRAGGGNPPPDVGELPPIVNPVNPPQEAGMDVPNVEIRGLGSLTELAVLNSGNNSIVYNKGDYLEPKDGDFQRMIIADDITVQPNSQGRIPVACRQFNNDIPDRGVPFFSMAKEIQSDENSACQVRCLDTSSSPVVVQRCVWNCESNPTADCTGNTPILGDNGMCRERIAADCTGATPILGDNGDCTAECTVVGADANCNCPTGQIDNNGTCEACSGGKTASRTGDMCVCAAGQIDNNGTCEACTNGKVPNATGDMCACAAGQTENDDGMCATIITIINPTRMVTLTISHDNCSTNGIRGMERNDDGLCVCPDGEEILTDGDLHACAVPLPDDIADELLPENCTSAGWLWEYLADPNGNFMQCCLTPVEITRTTPLDVATRADGDTPAQVSVGATINACVISQHQGFDADAANAGDIPPCDDPNLFGEYGGYPQKPEGFDDRTEGATRDRLAVQLGESGTPPSIMFVGDNNITIAVSPYIPSSGGGGNTGGSNTGGGGGGGGGAGIAIGAVAVLGGLAWLLWDGNPAAFTFSPQHSFSFSNESGYALHYGSRLEFNQDNWHMYWTASQNNRQGDFSQIHYGTGATYDAGFWAADFNNSAYGENTHMDFALKANADFGLWTISPQYQADYVYNENGEESISHALLAAGEWRRDRWTLTPSAGLNWNAFDDFGDSARVKVLMVRDL